MRKLFVGFFVTLLMAVPVAAADAAVSGNMVTEMPEAVASEVAEPEAVESEAVELETATEEGILMMVEPLPGEEAVSGEATEDVVSAEAVAEQEAPVVFEQETSVVAEQEAPEAPEAVEAEEVLEERPEWISEADTAFVEPIGVLRPEEYAGDITARNFSSITSDGAAKFLYYSQYAYQCKAGYSIIAAYVKDAEQEGKYKSRMFFIYDSMYGEWLRYDYGLSAAQTFLSDYETKESNGTTIYVPVVKTVSGKNVLQSNNSSTAIDESKIPTIAEADVSGINYAWKSLSDIPFCKNGSTYEYAGESKEEETIPTPPTPPTPGETKSVEAMINNANYTISWTAAVYYDGRAHLWNLAKVPAKNASKQVADINVEVIRDGALVSTSNYSVTCKNNTNVTGYNGSKKYQPYFAITLKGSYKKDNAKMSKMKFNFDIVPYPLVNGTLQAKKVVVEGTKTSFKDLYFIFPDRRKVKMTAYNAKKKTGSFTAAGTEEGIQITGYNNFSETGILSMVAPKRITYEW